MTAVARMHFTREEEYLAHWNSTATPWLFCPTMPCTYSATGEPDALDLYMGHMADHHLTSHEEDSLYGKIRRPAWTPPTGALTLICGGLHPQTRID